MGKDNPPPSEKEEKTGCCYLCSKIYSSARFWLMLIALSTMSVMVGVSSIIPIWLTEVFRPCTDTESENCNSILDSGHALMVASLQPLGVFCSLIYGMVYINKFTQKKKAKIMVLFLSTATLIVVACAVWTIALESGERPKDDPGKWVGGIAVFFFIHGFLVGYPYYIPAGVYAVEVGGSNCATLTAILNFGGLVLVGVLAYFGTNLSEAEGVSETAQYTWRYALYLLILIGIVSTVSMSGFEYLSLPAIEEENIPRKGETTIEIGPTDM